MASAIDPLLYSATEDGGPAAPPSSAVASGGNELYNIAACGVWCAVCGVCMLPGMSVDQRNVAVCMEEGPTGWMTLHSCVCVCTELLGTPV